MSVAKKAKMLIEDHSKRPVRSHLERLNTMAKHYVFYVLKVLEFYYCVFL